MLRKLFIVSLVLASAGFAQRGGGRGGGGSDTGGGMMPNAAPTKFDQISNALNLNKEQKKAARTVMDDAAKEATPLRDQLSKARIAIADAVQAKKSDAEIAQAVDAYAALAEQMTVIEINAFAKIHASLDETQKANHNGVNTVFVMMKNMFATKNWNSD